MSRAYSWQAPPGAPGKLELLVSCGHDPHQLLLEVRGPLADWTITLHFHPILFLWGRDGHRVLVFLPAEQHKVCNVPWRVEAVLREGDWGMGWGEGFTSGLSPNKPRATLRQCSSCADLVIRWVPCRSSKMKPFFMLFRSKTNRWTRRFWHNWCVHCILYCLSSSSIFAYEIYFVTIGQSIGLAWANRTSGKVGRERVSIAERKLRNDDWSSRGNQSLTSKI